MPPVPNHRKPSPRQSDPIQSQAFRPVFRRNEWVGRPRRHVPDHRLLSREEGRMLFETKGASMG